MTPMRYITALMSLGVALAAFGIPATASAASYTLTADKETFVIGDTFTVDVKIDSTDAGINAGQATLSFPKDIVQVTGLDKSSSAFDFWLQGPAYSNDAGTVTFIGGSQSGISGKSLEVLRITFAVKGAGDVGIIFSDGAITASDGSGTNVLTAMQGLHLTSITKQDAKLIAPPQIVRPAVPAAALPSAPRVTVPLYPDPAAWHGDISKFIAQWALPRDVTDVAAVIDQQPAFDPTASEGLFDNKTFSPLSDGIWYLHVRFKNSAGWGPTTHYRIGIDSTPPLSFAITSPDGLTTGNVAPRIAYATKDQPSGIAAYKIFVDGMLATSTTLTSYTLLPQSAGKHALIVQAIDKAGNTTESRVTLGIQEAPFLVIGGLQLTQFWFFTAIIIALLGGALLGWYLGQQERERRLRRTVIAQRDVHTVFGILKKGIDDLLKKYKGDEITAQEMRDMKVMLKRISETLEKDTQYLVENIEEIQS